MNRTHPELPEPIYVTPEGIEKMHERIIRLEREMPALSLEVQRTNAFGDRSENAEYQAAKRALRRAQGQLMRLKAQLKIVQPIPSGPDAGGAIRRGTTVIIEPVYDPRKNSSVSVEQTNPSGSHQDANHLPLAVEDNPSIPSQGRKIYRIVGPRETDPSSGRISAESPLGTALIGKQPGDTITIQTPNGARKWKIIDVA